MAIQRGATSSTALFSGTQGVGFLGSSPAPPPASTAGGGLAGLGGGAGAVSALAGLGSSVASAIATYRAGKAARKFAKEQAARQEKIGLMNASVVAINRRKLIGAQRAAAAGSGVVVNSGSPLDLMIDNFILGLVNESRALSDAAYRFEDIVAGGEVAFQAGVRESAGALVAGLTTGAQRGLFSINPDLPERLAGPTVLANG